MLFVVSGSWGGHFKVSETCLLFTKRIYLIFTVSTSDVINSHSLPSILSLVANPDPLFVSSHTQVIATLFPLEWHLEYSQLGTIVTYGTYRLSPSGGILVLRNLASWNNLSTSSVIESVNPGCRGEQVTLKQEKTLFYSSIWKLSELRLLEVETASSSARPCCQT